MHAESEHAVVSQQARHLTWTLAGRSESYRFLIRDRDQKFSDSFEEVFRSDGMEIIRTPFRAQANGVAERFVRTVRSQCLDWLLLLNQQHLERILNVFVDHYNVHSTSQERCAGPHSAPPDGPSVRAGSHGGRGSCPASQSRRWCGSRVRIGGVDEVSAPYRSRGHETVTGRGQHRSPRKGSDLAAIPMARNRAPFLPERTRIKGRDTGAPNRLSSPSNTNVGRGGVTVLR